MEKNKYDASSIDFSQCDMDGATLCNCAPEELRLVFGPLGDQLYSQLWDLSESGPLLPQGAQDWRGRPASCPCLPPVREAGLGTGPQQELRPAWLWEGLGARGQWAQRKKP